jgi:TolA-binding protein
MKHSERKHLKTNEFANAIGYANDWRAQHQRSISFTLIAVVVVVVGVLGFVAWRNSVDTSARTLLAEAMVVYEAPVQPASPPVLEGAGNESAAAPAAAPVPGSYPTERAKLEAALPKLMTAADEYPSTDPGQTARYHAASALVGLGRFDEAVTQYDRVIAEGSGLLAQMARLGKAEAQLRASQYDAAIASFSELANRTDVGLPKEAMLMELARAYRLAGKTEDARKTLTQIVEQHADSPFASEAKTELEKIKG